jgi:Ca2+-binding EF-hand superfamily protein
VILKILITNTYEDELMVRDGEDTILRAFEVLDLEKTGFIDSDKIIHLLETYGEPLDPEEIAEFRNAAEDPESHMIRYEDYASVLAHE